MQAWPGDILPGERYWMFLQAYRPPIGYRSHLQNLPAPVSSNRPPAPAPGWPTPWFYQYLFLCLLRKWASFIHEYAEDSCSITACCYEQRIIFIIVPRRMFQYEPAIGT